MCVRASSGKVSILIIVLQIHVFINKLVVTEFKTCWQFSHYLVGFAPGERFRRSFGAVLHRRRRRWGQSCCYNSKALPSKSRCDGD
jgi:hypothetical protein